MLDADNLNNLSAGSNSTGIMGEEDAILRKWFKADLFLELLGIMQLKGSENTTILF